jgi:hypothetical protein
MGPKEKLGQKQEWLQKIFQIYFQEFEFQIKGFKYF